MENNEERILALNTEVAYWVRKLGTIRNIYNSLTIPPDHILDQYLQFLYDGLLRESEPLGFTPDIQEWQLATLVNPIYKLNVLVQIVRFFKTRKICQAVDKLNFLKSDLEKTVDTAFQYAKRQNIDNSKRHPPR